MTRNYKVNDNVKIEYDNEPITHIKNSKAFSEYIFCCPRKYDLNFIEKKTFN